MNTMKSKLKLIACVLLFLAVRAASAATLPSGFSESVVANGISSPTAMAFAPDGRLFVCQQTGQLRVIKNDTLLAARFLTVTTDSTGERGLLGVAFDPDFANNQRVYSHAEGCAIVGAAFYNPVATQFPPEYTGAYFFADLCGGWIRKLDPAAGNQVSDFATGLSSPVDVAVSADGSLYYLERGSSSVSRVRFTSGPNVVTLTLVTQPSGLQLTLDGQTINTPYAVESVVGTTRTIGAPSPQQVGKHNYTFVDWSDGGAQTHVITTPGADTTYTAAYRKGGRP